MIYGLIRCRKKILQLSVRSSGILNILLSKLLTGWFFWFNILINIVYKISLNQETHLQCLLNERFSNFVYKKATFIICIFILYRIEKHQTFCNLTHIFKTFLLIKKNEKLLFYNYTTFSQNNILNMILAFHLIYNKIKKIGI